MQRDSKCESKDLMEDSLILKLISLARPLSFLKAKDYVYSPLIVQC